MQKAFGVYAKGFWCLCKGKCICTTFHHAQQYSILKLAYAFTVVALFVIFKLCEKVSYLSFPKLFLTMKFQ